MVFIEGVGGIVFAFGLLLFSVSGLFIPETDRGNTSNSVYTGRCSRTYINTRTQILQRQQR